MKHNKTLLFLFLIAFVIKFALWIFVTQHAPQSKMQIDSQWYLDSAQGLVKYGVFAREEGSRPQYHYCPNVFKSVSVTG